MTNGSLLSHGSCDRQRIGTGRSDSVANARATIAAYWSALSNAGDFEAEETSEPTRAAISAMLKLPSRNICSANCARHAFARENGLEISVRGGGHHIAPATRFVTTAS